MNENNENVIKESIETTEIDWNKEYLYLKADFDNFRRQKCKEIDRIRNTQNKGFILDMIDVLDDIERGNCYDSKGWDNIYTKMYNSLLKYGVERYCEVGDVFDSNIHNAITVSRTGNVDGGCICQIIKFGYKLNGEIIRFAEVIVEE